jgi:hypothetical protein
MHVAKLRNLARIENDDQVTVVDVVGLTGHLSNPPEPLANLLTFFELIREEPTKSRRPLT